MRLLGAGTRRCNANEQATHTGRGYRCRSFGVDRQCLVLLFSVCCMPSAHLIVCMYSCLHCHYSAVKYLQSTKPGKAGYEPYHICNMTAIPCPHHQWLPA
jgi:hypothetical protein